MTVVVRVNPVATAITFSVIGLLILILYLTGFCSWKSRDKSDLSVKPASADTPAMDLVVFAEQTRKQAARFKHGVEELFNKCDRNADGKVSKQELKNALKRLPFLMEELGLKRLKDASRFMEKCDTNKDKKITLSEWKNYLGRVEDSADDDAQRRAALVCNASDLQLIRATLDEMRHGDGTGSRKSDGVTVAELARGYCHLAAAKGKSLTVEKASRAAVKAFRKYDCDRNGKICLEEFIPMCLRGPFLEIFSSEGSSKKED